MSKLLFDPHEFRVSASLEVRNAYLETFASEMERFIYFLQEEELPDPEFIQWYLEADLFIEQLRTINNLLSLRQMVFLSVEWFKGGLLLTMTVWCQNGWKLMLVPWNVVREIRDIV